MKYDTILQKLNTAHMGFHVQSSSHKFRDCTFNTSQSAMSVHNCKLQTAHSCLQIKCRWYVSLSGLYHACRCTLHTRGLSARLLGARGSVNKRPQASRQRGELCINSFFVLSLCSMFNLPAEAVVLNQFEEVFTALNQISWEWIRKHNPKG